jgi:hypothetical protein
MSEQEDISITAGTFPFITITDPDYTKATEVTIPATKETFECQVVVITQPRKEMRFPYHGLSMSYHNILDESRRVIASRTFTVELIMPPMMPGKPTLIITEEEVAHE